MIVTLLAMGHGIGRAAERCVALSCVIYKLVLQLPALQVKLGLTRELMLKVIDMPRERGCLVFVS